MQIKEVGNNHMSRESLFDRQEENKEIMGAQGGLSSGGLISDKKVSQGPSHEMTVASPEEMEFSVSGVMRDVVLEKLKHAGGREAVFKRTGSGRIYRNSTQKRERLDVNGYTNLLNDSTDRRACFRG